MLKYVKGLINNKKGNVGFIYVVLIFIIMCINMVFGMSESSLTIATVNELKDILESVAPVAARHGINPNAHKNESLLDGYKDEEAKKFFVEEVTNSIEKMGFRYRINATKDYIADKLWSNTIVKAGRGKWVNTWGSGYTEGAVKDDRKEVDYVIVSTVLALDLKKNYGDVDVEKINDSFKTHVGTSEERDIHVDVDVAENAIGVFIKFEMKIVLK